jgi:zinc finger protein
MAETSSNEPEVIFKDLSADDEDQVPMEIESLCMQCHKNGITKIMCIRIPYYKQVIVISFLCDHCGFRNNELQSGEAVQEFGTEIVLHAKTKEDLNRQVVKSEYASIEIPELDLVIPNKSQPGEITTVEGVLMRVKNGLEQDQDRRKAEHPEAAEQIDQFISKLESFASLEKPFTLKLNDPSGNCYIQSPNPLHVDPRCIVSHYYRKLSDNKILGLADDNDEEEDPQIVAEREWKSYEDVKQEVLRFHVDCPGCGAPTETCMKPTDIPYFKEVIIMSTSCDTCGFKSNEVQASGATQEYGCRLSCEIADELDLARDVLKCDTCNMEIPELEIQVGYGALSSRFTTIEGLLQATREQLEEQSRFFMGDSAVDENNGTNKRTIQNVLDGIDEILALKRKATIILDDCAGNSYIQSLMAPMDDPKLHKTFYKRTFEQNEELGLNDMKTENYGEMDAIEEGDEEEEETKNEEEDAVKEDATTQEV